MNYYVDAHEIPHWRDLVEEVDNCLTLPDKYADFIEDMKQRLLSKNPKISQKQAEFIKSLHEQYCL